mmetsp:Transcript_26920/g.80707  ORF Transcript_26920/g.80707 Transcript_26920/m.80707 type:complete len:249 (-) Transcript_26920:511-1257(-)
MPSFSSVSQRRECRSAFFRRTFVVRRECASRARRTSSSSPRWSGGRAASSKGSGRGKSRFEGRSGHTPPEAQASCTRSSTRALMHQGTRPMASRPAKTARSRPRAFRKASVWIAQPCVRIATARSLKNPPCEKDRQGRGSTSMGRKRGMAARDTTSGQRACVMRSDAARIMPIFRCADTAMTCSSRGSPVSGSLAMFRKAATSAPPTLARVAAGQSASAPCGSSESRTLRARAFTTCDGSCARTLGSR